MRMRSIAAAFAALAALSACGGGGSPAPTATPTPTASTGTGGQVTYDVEPCFQQVVPGTGGQTVRQLIAPDAMTLDLARQADFPNGRDLDDQTVDITLAFLFLDLGATGQSLRTFANLPLNPPGSDRAPLAAFPYFAPPQGSPPIAATTGTTFSFRTDPDSAYVPVDRTGMPAIATALIGGPLRNAFNDASQTDDANGVFGAEMTAQLTALMNGIGDDLTALGLKVCAKTG